MARPRTAHRTEAGRTPSRDRTRPPCHYCHSSSEPLADMSPAEALQADSLCLIVGSQHCRAVTQDNLRTRHEDVTLSLIVHLIGLDISCGQHMVAHPLLVLHSPVVTGHTHTETWGPDTLGGLSLRTLGTLTFPIIILLINLAAGFSVCVGHDSTLAA